ncbi:hypothetical protein C5167_038800 [Papaver somniferum]|uniref:Protodermal factor 1 n=1 Tax=Papaver somniferum TaxID=3469 RepID=A0A4Y7IDM6_PAPSO|nr:protodermal factor 1-like [Papaver somniferum]RZC45852.1 hypothetical protein C5167_038800 [Papaver somniferum]
MQFYVLVIAAVLVSHQLFVLPGVMCRTFEFGDQKTYYPPDPHHGSPRSPSHGGGGRPSHGTPSTPSHSTPSTPSHGGGGGCPPTTSTPSTPSHSYSPPTTPTPVIVTPPTPVYVTPPTPTIVTPPVIVTPSTPTDPDFSSPPTPLIPDDPNLPPFIGTCDFWRTHPTMVWGLFGWSASVGSILGGGIGGVASIPSSLDTTITLPQALSNTHTDGIGALYREGVASLLNSMVTHRFPLTTDQIRQGFAHALSSERAALNQAQLFRRANEGRYKHRA